MEAGALSRTVGTAAGSALALALLVCCCVFAALAGPALSLHTRTQALHQTLAGYPNTTKTVQVTASWATFSGSLAGPSGPGRTWTTCSPRRLNDVGSRPAGDAAPARGRRLGQPEREADPRRGRRGGQRPRPGRRPSWTAVLATATARASPASRGWWRARSAAAAFPRRVGVAATTRDGRAVRDAPGQPPDAGRPVRPGHAVRHRHRAGTLARLDLLAAGHDPGEGGRSSGQRLASPLYTGVGGVIADPDQFGAIQSAFGGTGLALQLEFPLNLGGVNADQVQGCTRR